VKNEDVYVMWDFVIAIDCLEVGTSISQETGEVYKWAIYCGPVVEGAQEKLNMDYGEYQCAAARIGAGFSDDGSGLMSSGFPCQYIALAECGCGPSDVYTFGLPEPTGPCLPESGCPFLCEDAGMEHALNICQSFPGGIAWWEGQNSFNISWFIEGGMAPSYELEIYIKGQEN
jgi:hypothetical protein